MKKKNLFKSLVMAIAFLSVYTVSPAFAIEKKIDETVKLVYNGEENDGSAFELKVGEDNSSAKFVVEIRTADGTNIYKNIVQSGTLNKYLVNNELSAEGLKFVVTNLETKEAVTYKVNRFTKTVSETKIAVQ